MWQLGGECRGLENTLFGVGAKEPWVSEWDPLFLDLPLWMYGRTTDGDAGDDCECHHFGEMWLERIVVNVQSISCTQVSCNISSILSFVSSVGIFISEKRQLLHREMARLDHRIVFAPAAFRLPHGNSHRLCHLPSLSSLVPSR